MVFDMCSQELKDPETGEPSKKRTRLKTNSKAVVDHFREQQCRCSTPHRWIAGSTSVPQPDGTFKRMDLSTFAGGYTPRFARALLRQICRDVESEYLSQSDIDPQSATVVGELSSQPLPNSLLKAKAESRAEAEFGM